MIDYEKLAESVELPAAEPSAPLPIPSPAASPSPFSSPLSPPPSSPPATNSASNCEEANSEQKSDPFGNPPTGAGFDTSTVFEDPRADDPEAIQRRANREFLPLTHEKYQGIAAAKGYKQEDFSGNRLQRVHYTHEAMIDVIIAEPTITQNELAKKFGKSVSWISVIMGSDSFQAALAKRRDDVTNPFLIATVEERLRGLADQSLQIIADKLEKTQNADLALKALDLSTKALGFGARNTNQGAVQNNFVIQLPTKAADSAEWAKSRIIDQ